MLRSTVMSEVSRTDMEGRPQEVLLTGTILVGDGLDPTEGRLYIRNGIVKEIEEASVQDDARHQVIICPRLVNAHTHLGDSAFKDPPFAPLEKLVGPGSLKERMLKETPRQELVRGIRSSLLSMVETGTCAFADFREGGPLGVDMLLEALRRTQIISRALGRPKPGSLEVHPACWGVGISSTRDHPKGWLDDLVEAARGRGMKVAIHAGEAGRDDIEDALRLEPDFLVHLTRATRRVLRKVAAAGTPAVICPRSNLVTGAGLPDLESMVELGITVGLGTDNVMLNSPNLLREMELVSKALLHDDRQVFKMCTLNGAAILGIDQKVGSISVGKEARIMVLDGRSKNMRGSVDPIASVVRRAEPSDILDVL